jgi:hypothetical protein
MPPPQSNFLKIAFRSVFFLIIVYCLELTFEQYDNKYAAVETRNFTIHHVGGHVHVAVYCLRCLHYTKNQ